MFRGGLVAGSEGDTDMITKRIIPCLDVRDGRVVKGVNFEGLQDVNDPVELAAYYSKGRFSSSVPVDYCLVKELKKVKGAKPGFVTFRNYKTIYIDPYEDKELNIVSI